MYCNRCGQQIGSNDIFCPKCGNQIESVNPISVTAQVSRSNTQVTTNSNYSTKQIYDYLSYAKKLETERYTIQCSIDRLQAKVDALGHYKNIEKPGALSFLSVPGFAWFGGIATFIIAWVVLAFSGHDGIGDFFFDMIFNLEIITDPLISLLWGLGGAVVGLVVGFIFDSAEYSNEHKTYENNVQNDQNRVAREKKQVEILNDEIAELQFILFDIEDARDKFYSLNVVYPKYCDLIPIVTMHEYIESQRCFDLTGPNGAYNIYEYETRQDIIISKLDQVISLLYEIRNNQYALYQAISEGNAIAQKIYDQSERILATSQSIKENSEIAAYNSKIAATNSTISAYVDVFYNIK